MQVCQQELSTVEKKKKGCSQARRGLIFGKSQCLNLGQGGVYVYVYVCNLLIWRRKGKTSDM